jgi:hypothetical protein
MVTDIGVPGYGHETLSSLASGREATTIGTLGSATASAVLLGADYFADTADRQMNVLLHELLHALGGLHDPDIFNNSYYLQNGLQNADYQQFGNTDEITQWLMRDCHKQ